MMTSSAPKINTKSPIWLHKSNLILEYMYFEILFLVNFRSIKPDFSYTVYQSFQSDPSAIGAIIIELSHADLIWHFGKKHTLKESLILLSSL